MCKLKTNSYLSTKINVVLYKILYFCKVVPAGRMCFWLIWHLLYLEAFNCSFHNVAKCLSHFADYVLAIRSRTSDVGNLWAISIMARYWVEIPDFSASFSCEKPHFRRFSRRFFAKISRREGSFSMVLPVS